MTVPHSAVQIELADLQQIAGAHVHAAAKIPFPVRHQIPVIAAELERTRNQTIEQIGDVFAGRRIERGADEIGSSGAIGVTGAGIVGHRQVKRKAPPIGLRALALHGAFIAGRGIVIIVAGETGAMGQELRERDLTLARIRVGEGTARLQKVVDMRLRADARAFVHGRAKQNRGEGLPRRADVVGRLAVKPVKIFLQHQTPAPRDKQRMNELRTTRGGIAVGNALHQSRERLLLETDRTCARRAPAIAQTRRRRIDISRRAGRSRQITGGAFIAARQHQRNRQRRPSQAQTIAARQEFGAAATSAVRRNEVHCAPIAADRKI